MSVFRIQKPPYRSLENTKTMPASSSIDSRNIRPRWRWSDLLAISTVRVTVRSPSALVTVTWVMGSVHGSGRFAEHLSGA